MMNVTTASLTYVKPSTIKFGHVTGSLVNDNEANKILKRARELAEQDLKPGEKITHFTHSEESTHYYCPNSHNKYVQRALRE